jgi:hypothetical protein
VIGDLLIELLPEILQNMVKSRALLIFLEAGEREPDFDSAELD